MARDPSEGVGPEGTIATGAGAHAIHRPYQHVLDTVARALSTRLGGQLHSLYLFGSIATGQAKVPTSDLDLYAVTHGDAATAARALATEQSLLFKSTVRAVTVSTIPLDAVFENSEQGHAERCFLRHYCVFVAGSDLRPDLSDCRATPALARGMNGKVGAVMDGVADRLSDEGIEAEDRRRVTAFGAKKLLMSAATLLSVAQGRWSTDRDDGAVLLREAAPELGSDVGRALEWSSLDTSGRELPSVTETLESFAALRDWLVEGYERRS